MSYGTFLMSPKEYKLTLLHKGGLFFFLSLLKCFNGGICTTCDVNTGRKASVYTVKHDFQRTGWEQIEFTQLPCFSGYQTDLGYLHFKPALLLSCGIHLLLILGHQVIHGALSLDEIQLIHAQGHCRKALSQNMVRDCSVMCLKRSQMTTKLQL